MAFDTPHKRLKSAREHAGFKDLTEACKRHGWPYENYKKHENDERRRMDPGMVPAYARAYGVNPEWILWGLNPPKWANPAAPIDHRARPSFRAVPRVTMEHALQMPEHFARLLKLSPETPMDSGADVGPRSFATEVEDDSMVANPTGPDSFHPGDICVFDPDREPPPGGFVLAHIAGEAKPVIRKYRPRIAGAFDLVPLNSDYAVETISGKSPAVRIIGLMVRHIRIYGRQ